MITEESELNIEPIERREALGVTIIPLHKSTLKYTHSCYFFKDCSVLGGRSEGFKSNVSSVSGILA